MSVQQLLGEAAQVATRDAPGFAVFLLQNPSELPTKVRLGGGLIGVYIYIYIEF